MKNVRERLFDRIARRRIEAFQRLHSLASIAGDRFGRIYEFIFSFIGLSTERTNNSLAISNFDHDLTGDTKTAQLQSLFVMGMNDAIDGGLDFNVETHETLRELLGEWTAQQFFAATATQSTTPELFVRAASKALPERSLHVIFDMIARRASSKILTASYQGESRFQRLMRELHEEVGGGKEGKSTRPLHDQRSTDELDELVGHRTD